MLFIVQKSFQAGRERLERGATIELTPSRRTQLLVESRYLIAADAETASASTTPVNEATDAVVRRQTRKGAPTPSKD